MVPRRRLAEGLAKVREQYLTRRAAWRAQQWQLQRANPNLSPPQEKRLAERIASPELSSQGVYVHIGADFPTGTRPEDLANYPDIVRAFSRTFGPNLFEELSLTDPFPSGDPYWSNFFATLNRYTQTGTLQLNVSKSGSTFCPGVDGGYQPGGPMAIFDCSGEPDIFHEIGHAVADDGILKGRAPMYFRYAIIISGQPQLFDAKERLTKWFGKTLDTGVDIDGVDIGFVSNYAMPENHVVNQRVTEDFAETFMHYVYYPSNLWDKVDRQLMQGSQTLSKKAELIAALYAGMWFSDGGVPAGWPGYSL